MGLASPGRITQESCIQGGSLSVCEEVADDGGCWEWLAVAEWVEEDVRRCQPLGSVGVGVGVVSDLESSLISVPPSNRSSSSRSAALS